MVYLLVEINYSLRRPATLLRLLLLLLLMIIIIIIINNTNNTTTNSNNNNDNNDNNNIYSMAISLYTIADNCIISFIQWFIYLLEKLFAEETGHAWAELLFFIKSILVISLTLTFTFST